MSPFAAAAGCQRAGARFLRWSALRLPLTVHRRPTPRATAPRSGPRQGLRWFEPWRRGVVSPSPAARGGGRTGGMISDPSILPRATAQRRDVQAAGKVSGGSKRGERGGVSPLAAAPGSQRAGGRSMARPPITVGAPAPEILPVRVERRQSSVFRPPSTAHRLLAQRRSGATFTPRATRMALPRGRSRHGRRHRAAGLHRN